MSKFIPWPPDKRRASFFHIVNWFKNFQISRKRFRDASRYTSKKISLKLLFLSDIFLLYARHEFILMGASP